MLEFISQFAGFLWPVLCHSLWSVPLIGLLFGIRIETLSPTQCDRRMRIAILACIAAPFAIALVSQALTSIKLRTPESHFEMPSLSSSVTRKPTFEENRTRPISAALDLTTEPSPLRSLDSIVSEAVESAILVWFAGMAVLTVRLFAGTLLFRIRTKFEPADSKSQSIANDLAHRIGLRNSPVVRISKSVKQPMAMGLFKAGVILPLGWANDCDEAQLEAVLAHELAHIRRRDVVFVLIERTAGIVWCFHPAMHLLNRQAVLWREMAADRVAIEVTGNRLALARALESAARFVGGMPRFTPFESNAITFASPRYRGVLGTRVEALLGPKGVCPVKISKKLCISYFALSIAFAVMATKLAAIGQESRPIERKSTGNSAPIKSDPFVKQVSNLTVRPPRNLIRIGKMDRISSKMLRNAEVPAPNPSRSFDVRFLSITGDELDRFLNEKFEPMASAGDPHAWFVDLEQVSNAATANPGNMMHQVPTAYAADGESLDFKFTLPLTTIHYHPVHKSGEFLGVKDVLQTTEFEIRARVTGKSGLSSTSVEIKGLETMPKVIERVSSPVKTEGTESRPMHVSEIVVTAQSEEFEAVGNIPLGKSLVIKLGRTIEQTEDTAFVSLLRVANRKLRNREVYPYRTIQRYLIVTPAELP